MFFILLLLSGLLLAATGAQGALAGPLASTSALEEDFESLEDELEESEEGDYTCEEAEVEFELGEIDEVEAEEVCREAAESRGKRGKGRSQDAPEECVLRSARAHAALDEKSSKLKITLGYTTYEPVNAKIKIGNLTTLQRHLGRSGVLRIVEPVSEKRLKRLVVNLKLRAVKSAGCPFRRLVLFPR